MNIERIADKLQSRYGNPVHHHGDCRVYALDFLKIENTNIEIEKDCSCGLLHDLRILSWEDIRDIKKIINIPDNIKGFRYRDYDKDPPTEEENNFWDQFARLIGNKDAEGLDRLISGDKKNLTEDDKKWLAYVNKDDGSLLIRMWAM